jgi:membrane associated rhomboid family serine protease/Flp pilus assembly protein TadD
MPQCIQCGKELPSFTIGEQSDFCRECTRENAIREAAEAKPHRTGMLELAKLFPVTSVILILNVLVFAITAIATLKTGHGTIAEFDSRLLVRLGADYGPLTLDREWWRVFTCMFLHGGLIHVAANMYCFWQLGRIAERIYGGSRYALIYLITGIASSIASLAIHPASVSVGASGAIFGVVGALVVPFYTKRLQLPPPVMKSILRSLVTFIGLNLMIGILIPVIDNAAHIGGLLAGLSLGAVWMKLADRGRFDSTAVARVTAVALVLCAAGFAGVQQFHKDRILAWQAVTALNSGNQQLALEKAQKAVARRPKDVPAHNVLGAVYFDKAQYEDAAKQFEQSLQLDKKDAYAQSRLGASYAHLQRWGEAEPRLREALRRKPEDAEMLLYLGFALRGMGRIDEALQEIQKSVRNNPASATGQFALGSLLMEKGQIPQAIAAMREAVRLNPANENYKALLARAEARAEAKY